MIVLYIILILTFAYATINKSKRALHMLQQNLYNENNRYIKWVIKNKKTTVMLSVVVALVTVFSTVSVNPLMKGFSGVYKKPISKELKKSIYSPT